jgi:hypothetical protein
VTRLARVARFGRSRGRERCHSVATSRVVAYRPRRFFREKPAVCSGFLGWSVPGSNRRPPACKASAAFANCRRLSPIPRRRAESAPERAGRFAASRHLCLARISHGARRSSLGVVLSKAMNWRTVATGITVAAALGLTAAAPTSGAAAPAGTTVRADDWVDAFRDLAPVVTRALQADAAFTSAFGSDWLSKRTELRRLATRARSAWALMLRRVRVLPVGSKDENAVTVLLVRAAMKNVSGYNRYLRALTTRLYADIKVGDRLIREANVAFAEASRIARKIGPLRPGTLAERELGNLADSVQELIPLISRMDSLYTDMIRALRKGGIGDPTALADGISEQVVLSRIVSRLHTIGPYKTSEIQMALNSLRVGFFLMQSASREYVAGMRSHRPALLTSADKKWQRGEALRARGLRQLAALTRKLTG